MIDFESPLVVMVTLAIVFVTSGWGLNRLSCLKLKRHGLALVGSNVSKKFTLIDRTWISPSICSLRFGLPEDTVLGLPIGRHISVSAVVANPLTHDNPKSISRQYTPVSSDHSAVGYFDLIVRVYWKNENPQFPEGGWMSQYLAGLPIGSQLDCRGPCGRIEYLEKGMFRLGQIKKRYHHVVMIAGGTGITPMFQLINHVLKTRAGADTLKLSLLFGNRNPGDIILRNELESLASMHQNQFKLTFTVDKADPARTWSGYVGFVTTEMIKAALTPPNPNTLVLICGPPPMVKSVAVSLSELGYKKEDIHQF